MSKPLLVSIPHGLGKEEALARLTNKLTEAAEAFPIMKVEDETWMGDRMYFRVSALGQVAQGTVDVGAENVRVEVTLPWMLQRFAERILRTLQSRGRLLLDKK